MSHFAKMFFINFGFKRILAKIVSIDFVRLAMASTDFSSVATVRPRGQTQALQTPQTYILYIRLYSIETLTIGLTNELTNL